MQFITEIIVTGIQTMTLLIVHTTAQALVEMIYGMRTGNGQSYRRRGTTGPCSFKGFPFAIKTKIFHGGIAKITLLLLLLVAVMTNGIVGPVVLVGLPLLASCIVEGRSGKAGSDTAASRLADMHKNEGSFRPGTPPTTNVVWMFLWLLLLLLLLLLGAPRDGRLQQGVGVIVLCRHGCSRVAKHDPIRVIVHLQV